MIVAHIVSVIKGMLLRQACNRKMKGLRCRSSISLSSYRFWFWCSLLRLPDDFIVRRIPRSNTSPSVEILQYSREVVCIDMIKPRWHVKR
jgi:hypothetical protein